MSKKAFKQVVRERMDNLARFHGHKIRIASNIYRQCLISIVRTLEYFEFPEPSVIRVFNDSVLSILYEAEVLIRLAGGRIYLDGLSTFCCELASECNYSLLKIELLREIDVRKRAKS